MEIYKSKNDVPLIDWQWYEPSLRNITHLILKYIPKTGGRALDVGCGTGRVSFALAERGFEVMGIDKEERVINIAKKFTSKGSLNPKFEIADFLDPSFVKPELFDLVVSSEVLEHIKDYNIIIENIYKTLKPGGRVIITVPYDERKWSVLDEYGGHIRRYTIPQIKRDLSRFTNIKIMITGFPFYRLLVNAYIAKIKLFKQKHSNEMLWEMNSTKLLAKFLYPFMRVDNFFSFTRLGDALIVIADKDI